MQRISVTEKIRRFLSSCQNATAETLRRRCDVPPHARKSFSLLLSRMVSGGELTFQNGLYALKPPLLLTGVLTGNERGFAFFTPDENDVLPVGEDVFVPAKNLHGAMHKDKVLLSVTKKAAARDLCDANKTQRRIGEVVKIIERGYVSIVGAFYKDKRGGRLLPDERKYFSEIYIPLASCRNIKSGVKAVANILSYRDGRCPEGEITEVLGDDDDFFAEETSIIRGFSLSESFPPEVLTEAETVAAEDISDLSATSDESIERVDLRNERFVTIDGADTRDLDDGVWVEKCDEGYVLSVHIADVSHYVKRGGALDNEAFRRGTSVYFPDRVLPMLPPVLSNGCCSLDEGVDRLAITCRALIADKRVSAADGREYEAGEVVSCTIFPSLVRSTHRLTYDEVDAMLQGDEATAAKYPSFATILPHAAALTQLLSSRRKGRGEVVLDVKEKHIFYDAKTDVVSVPDVKDSPSRELIEQFMVTANECVASFLSAKKSPCLYRVHQQPVPEKAASLKTFARLLGFSPRWSDDDVQPRDYAALLAESRGTTKETILSKVLLRSMQKARYCEENLGHFALVSEKYCHFTSPIRRYPDLFVHRALKAALSPNETLREKTKAALEQCAADTAKRCSETEKTADECERAVDDLYACAYMSDRIDETFFCVVSGVTERGIFVELKNGIEGFVPVETLKDRLTFVPDLFTLKGYKEKYTLGDELSVRLQNVDFYTRRITFSVVYEP